MAARAMVEIAWNQTIIIGTVAMRAMNEVSISAPQPSRLSEVVSRSAITVKSKPSKEEIEHMGRVKSLPCIICERMGLRQVSPTDAHHIKRDPETGESLGAAQKGSGFTTIPLCFPGIQYLVNPGGLRANYGTSRGISPSSNL